MVFRRQTLALTRREVLIGVGLGVLYGLAQLLQTIGLEHTSASVSGFVTGTYVVLTPVFGALLLRDRINRTTWVGGAPRDGRAGGALAARALGRLRRGRDAGLGRPLRAAHRRAWGATRPRRRRPGWPPCRRSSSPRSPSWPRVPGGITLPATGGQWTSLLYMALVAGAVALWAQTWAQSHLPATRAAIVMTMEPVFATFFAVLFGGESLTGRMVAGRRDGAGGDVRRRGARSLGPPVPRRPRTGPPSCCTTRSEGSLAGPSPATATSSAMARSVPASSTSRCQTSRTAVPLTG